MPLNFNIKIGKKITYNVNKPGISDQLPENVRNAMEKAASGIGVTTQVTNKIIINGQEFGSVEEMPDAMRKVYEMAINAKNPGGTTLEIQASGGLVDISASSAQQMAGLFPKFHPEALLRWEEPEAARIARYEVEKRSFSKLLPFIIIISMLLIFALGRFAPGMDMRILYAALIGSIGMKYLLMFIGRATSVCISITDNEIVQGFGKTAKTWKFKRIHHCEIGGAAAGIEGQNVLVVQTGNSRRSIIGIAPPVTPEEIRALLESKGVKVVMRHP